MMPTAAMSTDNFLTLMLNAIFIVLINTILYGGLIYLLFLLVRALRKYLRTEAKADHRGTSPVSLAEALKAHRQRCKMTQEFVAEQLDVSRQAVSKWENGSAEPSTSNLLALAKLYAVSPEELCNAKQE